MALSEQLTAKLIRAESDYEEFTRRLSDPELVKNQEELKRLGKAMGELGPLVSLFKSLNGIRAEREKLEKSLDGEGQDFVELARKEIAELEAREQEAEEKLRKMAQAGEGGAGDGRGVILEIRAGTGGEEAALFASDLFRMYMRFADARGWKAEIVEMHRTERGGIREAIASIEGKEAWRLLRHEGGVHRVQRVPVTEASGRLHTSAVAVVVLPQAEEVDVKINPEELRIDTFCSSGPGGQSVNTSYSAVRIVHLPSGIVVQCQDERSQVKNRARALKVLRARLLAAKADAQNQERGKARREQVRTADRSEKIRTYNFPQDRVTDHRIGVTMHRIEEIMDGDLAELLGALDSAAAEGKLAK